VLAGIASIHTGRTKRTGFNVEPNDMMRLLRGDAIFLLCGESRSVPCAILHVSL
jgi:hypothetical protein